MDVGIANGNLRIDNTITSMRHNSTQKDIYTFPSLILLAY